jgi:hypothetical protein
MSWRVVIAGGGLRRLLRRARSSALLRLLVDWNVALAFDRDTSSPWRLGTPARLESE